MTPWKLTDGTVVHLGGNVEGDSPLAAQLRTAANEAKRGSPGTLCIGPPPGSRAVLDLDDAQLVNVWVRQVADRAGVAVYSAPNVEPFADDDREMVDEPDDGPLTIY